MPTFRDKTVLDTQTGYEYGYSDAICVRTGATALSAANVCDGPAGTGHPSAAQTEWPCWLYEQTSCVYTPTLIPNAEWTDAVCSVYSLCNWQKRNVFAYFSLCWCWPHGQEGFLTDISGLQLCERLDNVPTLTHHARDQYPSALAALSVRHTW